MSVVRSEARGMRARLCTYFLLGFLAAVCSRSSFAGGGPQNVLVVYNAASSRSFDIATHYVAVRGIPADNVLGISCSIDEFVPSVDCERDIITPIKAFLNQRVQRQHDNALAGLPQPSRIDYVVLAKDIPLGADYGAGNEGPLSVSSVLSCACADGLFDMNPPEDPYRNPYGPTAASTILKAFQSDLPEFGTNRFYIVTRLDGYTTADIMQMIDRSVQPRPPSSRIAIDRAMWTGGRFPGVYYMFDDKLDDANTLLTAKGVPTVFDNTTAFIGGQGNLLGYFSWGSNDPAWGTTGFTLYTTNSFVAGSIADTYVSTSGRTFNDPGLPRTGQSLVADLLHQGACAVSGYVSEPYLDACFTNYPDVLLDRYSSGYNAGESFFAACPQLYWKSVVVGDPLMAPFAVPPQVSIVPQDGQAAPSGASASVISQPMVLSGQVSLVAAVTGSSGVSKVEFYFDGGLIGAVSQSPYRMTFDSTQQVVGLHTLEVVAYDGSPMATQGRALASVTVQNATSKLVHIADAFHSPDGQGVVAAERVVSAAGADLGGNEFYVQDPDRSAGIRVASSVAVNRGDIVTITGPLSTSHGERFIDASGVLIVSNGTAPRPLGMPNKAVGGGGVTTNTPGVSGGTGIRSLGLLVRTWGTVTYADAGSFYIDDGTHLSDGSGHIGLKVVSRGLVAPIVGKVAAVTGISSSEDIGGSFARTIRIRDAGDVSILGP